MPPVTLSDVARDAGVSLATASRVLNGSRRVPGREVSLKVQASADRLGYVANASAQALARAHSGLIGVIVQDLEDPYFSTIAAGFQHMAAADGRLALLAQTSRDPELTVASLQRLLAQRIDGLLMIGSLSLEAGTEERLRALISDFVGRGGLFASIGQDFGVGRTIRPADRDGGWAIGHAMVQAGYRRFAVLEDTTHAPAGIERAAGFVAAIEEAGCSVEFAAPGAFTAASGRTLGEELVAHLTENSGALLEEGPLCFFALSDAVGVSVLGQVLHAGFRVPEDVAVVGFDGIPVARDLHPTLTTVDLPLHAMGEFAYQLVAGGTEDVVAPVDWLLADDAVTVPGALVLGESTGTPGS